MYITVLYIIWQIDKDDYMAKNYGESVEKVTFNMPTELKEQIMLLKDELKISMSAIYNEAISNYLKQKELEKWHKGVSLALKDKDYMAFSEELGSDTGDLYEY
jgi:post-segregation antitoxin (ccd killing protein)